MNDDNDVLAAARDSLAGVRMRRPMEAILRAGRAHQRRRRLAGVGFTAVMAAAVAGVALALPAGSPGGAPVARGGGETGAAPATAEVRPVGFTVRVNNDGSVDFTATELVDTVAATRALNDAGIAGRVLKQTTGCPEPDDDDVAVWPPRPRPSSTAPPDFGIAGGQTITLKSSFYPQGGGLLVLIDVRQRPTGPWVEVGWRGYGDVNKIPTCVDNRDPGTY
jgi:hypothetical protein